MTDTQGPGADKRLLAIVELGGYPDFTPLYRRLGFSVATVNSAGRKAVSELKRQSPDVVVCEFNYQPDFRDRTSSLESLLATIQRNPATRVIVFYDAAEAGYLEKLRVRFPQFEAMAYPIEEAALEAALREG